MSCMSARPHRRLPAEAGRLLVPALRDAPDDVLWVTAWDTREAAAESRRANEENHGHRGAVHGPFAMEVGWVNVLDLRPAIARAGRRVGL